MVVTPRAIGTSDRSHHPDHDQKSGSWKKNPRMASGPVPVKARSQVFRPPPVHTAGTATVPSVATLTRSVSGNWTQRDDIQNEMRNDLDDYLFEVVRDQKGFPSAAKHGLSAFFRETKAPTTLAGWARRQRYILEDSKPAARSKMALESGCSWYPKQSFEMYGGLALEKRLNINSLRVPY